MEKFEFYRGFEYNKIMNKEILSAHVVLANPDLLNTGSSLTDYKKHPLWGRPVFKEFEHPFFRFFSKTFSCQKFDYINNPLVTNLPKNLYSTNPKDLEKDFHDFLWESCPDKYSATSEFFKAKATKSYAQHIFRTNQNRINKHDFGIDLSKGSLGVFLLDLSAKLLVFEGKLTAADKNFCKEYIFLLEDSIRLELIARKLTAA